MIPERWALIEELFHRAAECEPQQRTALLDEACSNDPELRREVEALLSSDGGARGYVQAAVSSGLGAFCFPLVGETISHYRILDGLGGGGMGLVYRAEDIKLGRQVALKFLPDECVKDPVALGRFEREARSASALEHPNICPIYEFAEHKGKPFLVMQLLEGATLRESTAAAVPGKPPLELSTLLDLSIQILNGLEAAHRRGIIHRDIKPANIFVTVQGQAKILDFGLAKPAAIISGTGDTSGLDPRGDDADEGIRGTAPQPSRQRHITRAGMAMGTAGYMSPEQARSENLDARTDLFSFGLVLYEIATGKRAFTDDTGRAVQEANFQQMPDLPRTGNAGLPTKLEKIITKALERNRDARYLSASDMRADLEALKREMAPKSAGRLLPTRWLALALSLILAGSGYFAWHGFRPHPSPLARMTRLAVLPFENLGGDPEQEYFSDGLTEEMITQLGSLNPERLGVIARTSVMAYKHSSKGIKQVGRELVVDYLLTGSVYRFGDHVRIRVQLIQVNDQTELWTASFERDVRDVLALHADVAREVADEIRIRLAPGANLAQSSAHPVNPEAHDAYLKGLYFWNELTVPGLKKSVEYFQRAIELDPNYGQPHAGLAATYSIFANLRVLPPNEAYPMSIAAAKQALQLDGAVSEAHSELGFGKMFYDHNWSEAEKEFRRALELNPSNANARDGYAEYLAAMGRLNEAIAESQRALQSDPLSLLTNVDYGLILLFARRYDEAVVHLQKLKELDENFPAIYWCLAQVYEAKGMYEEAYQADLKSKLLTFPSPPRYPLVKAMEQGHARAGWKGAYQNLLKYELRHRSSGHNILAYLIADSYRRLGNKDQALEWLLRAPDEHYYLIVFAKVDPRYDSLRSDPRFADLLHRIGLPP